MFFLSLAFNPAGIPAAIAGSDAGGTEKTVEKICVELVYLHV